MVKANTRGRGILRERPHSMKRLPELLERKGLLLVEVSMISYLELISQSNSHLNSCLYLEIMTGRSVRKLQIRLKRY